MSKRREGQKSFETGYQGATLYEENLSDDAVTLIRLSFRSQLEKLVGMHSRDKRTNVQCKKIKPSEETW